MGLDIVEFIVAAENQFEVSFDNEELCRIRTVGEFHELVLKELGYRHPHPAGGVNRICTSSRAFYRLRQAMVESHVAPRKDIRVKTTLESLIPRRGRREAWEEVTCRVRCLLPRLRRTTRVLAGIAAFTVAVAVFPLAFGALRSSTDTLVWLGLSGAGLPLLCLKLSEPQAVEFPPDCRTAGDLAAWLAQHHPLSFSQPDRSWPEGTVWDRIVSLLVETQGLKPHQITPEATFVGDLRMD